MAKKIPRSHQIGNLASKKLHALLASCDILSEDIKNDYGEDLLLQTHLEEVADNFHVFMQVKGVSANYRSVEDELFSIKIDVSDLNSWCSLNSAFLLCIYNAKYDKIYAVNIQAMFSLWQLATTKNKSFTIKIDRNDIMDASNIRKFVWAVRVDYYARMLSWYDVMERDVISGRSDKVRSRFIKKERIMIVFSFLRSIGILSGDGFREDFLSSIIDSCSNVARNNQERAPADRITLGEAFILILMVKTEELIEVGLPRIIIEDAANMLLNFFRVWNRRDYDNVISQFEL